MTVFYVIVFISLASLLNPINIIVALVRFLNDYLWLIFGLSFINYTFVFVLKQAV